jgi:FlaA1/EpsC-like NDP-sugar epimerase
MSLKGKSVLVTGGTGSMGKTMVKRLLSAGADMPSKIIVLSRDEAKQHDMRVDYLHRGAATDAAMYDNFQRALEFRIGDVRNFSDVVSAARDADVIINAAALKQVPVCEYFPEQAVLTNCIGAANIVRAINENRLPVETVVAVSTDKACKPVNVMGMTKAIQERIITSANVLNPGTRFVSVRYGNVLASRGSVVPLFHDQIAAGGPITITDARMTRFLISLNEAVDTVLEAIDHALPGETYIPSAPGANMVDLAKALIGDRSIEIKYTGIRPGEKFDEILVSVEEAHQTIRRGDYYVIRPMLPELANKDADSQPRPLKAAFSSSLDVLDLAGVTTLLAKNGLLYEDGKRTDDKEMLA